VLLKQSSSARISETNRRKCEAGYFSVRNEESSMMRCCCQFHYVLSAVQASPLTGISETNRRKSEAKYFSLCSEKPSTMRNGKADLDFASAGRGLTMMRGNRQWIDGRSDAGSPFDIVNR
jgi:hypothetical protein